jgi:hypothetical protein
MTDINGYLYSGQNRVGTSSNPICVEYSTATPSSFTRSPQPDFVPLPPEIKYVDRIIEVPVTVEVPYYNIEGSGLFFRFWYWIGIKMEWIHGR